MNYLNENGLVDGLIPSGKKGEVMSDGEDLKQIQVILDALHEGASLLDTLEQVAAFDGHEKSLLKDARELVELVREMFIDRHLHEFYQESPEGAKKAAETVEDGVATMEAAKERVYRRMMQRMRESKDPLQRALALQTFDPDGEIH